MSDSEKYNVKTSVGLFKVYKTKTHLRVGGKNFCVEILFQDPKMPEAAELQWLITKEGGCELEGKIIQGDNTAHLLKLSLTLLKVYRNVQYVRLLDNSKYDCVIDDKIKKSIFINKYSYLFHGETWYEMKACAIPVDPSLKALYYETKPLYTEPLAKPSVFDFKNTLLNTELTPIYHATKTWKEFADIIHERYDKKTLCKKILPWYESALAILTNDRMLPEYWKIDISDINIPFTRIMTGGKRNTRKGKYILPSQEHFIVGPSELYNKIL
jgi:hypothetical protein